MRIGLLASWDPLWIRDHVAWLMRGSHRDGWKNAIREEHRRALKGQDEFSFFAYLAKSRGGSGLVGYRIVAGEFEYYPVQQAFSHAFGQHDDRPDPYDVRFSFSVIRVDQLTPARAPGSFRTADAKRINAVGPFLHVIDDSRRD